MTGKLDLVSVALGFCLGFAASIALWLAYFWWWDHTVARGMG